MVNDLLPVAAGRCYPLQIARRDLEGRVVTKTDLESTMSKQHTSPCGECCFSRACPPGALGGSSPLTYIGQTEGPFWIPCHCPADYANKDTQYGAPQCAGAAIYRANLGLDGRMPDGITKLPADNEACFSSHAEFLSHHCQIPKEAADSFLESVTPEMLLDVELADKDVRLVKTPVG